MLETIQAPAAEPARPSGAVALSDTVASSDTLPLTDNARAILLKRYVRRGPDGRPVETPEAMFLRVARGVAAAELELGGDAPAAERDFLELLTQLRFFPNSPTFTGAGTPLGQLAACFVLPISDDMGRDPAGIFQTLRDAALIQQTGGGNGFGFSRLRPQGGWVHTSAGRATGPIGFLRVYDAAFGEIAQGGTRRGANMAVLRVDHPDIEAFIGCKTDEQAITNFNISVGITDAFMAAVRDDGPWSLRFVDLEDPAARGFKGTLEEAERAGIPIKVHRRLRARELFDRIVRQAHHNGEPGLLFLDAANRANPVPHRYTLEATNPCGEQWLGPYENCCLGSINLARHLLETPDGMRVDWELLRRTVASSTRFLDDVVTANAYVPAVPRLREAALDARRIGLGIMGLGDLLYALGVAYDSAEGRDLAGQVMEFVRFHAMRSSIDLAAARGPFPAIRGSVYDPAALRWTPPRPLESSGRDWGRPELDWREIEDGIASHGIRNAAQTTVAPTGTIASVAGCEAYGCEPVFALAYQRHVVDADAAGDGRTTLTYGSPLFERALREAGLDAAAREAVLAEVLRSGSCQGLAVLPEALRRTFVVSGDVGPMDHVRMQAAVQAFVDNSISKTINFPPGATEDQVAEVYMRAWELGCKGLTVYVTGSREKVVLETRETQAARQLPAGSPAPALAAAAKRPRPRRLAGGTTVVETPLGKAFVTVNEQCAGEPFEVFLNVGKAGSDTAAVAEAIGRLITLLLRLPSLMDPHTRLRQVASQLRGIGGGRPLGYGAQRVRSLPDGVAQALGDYLAQGGAVPADAAARDAVAGARDVAEPAAAVPGAAPAAALGAAAIGTAARIGDLCPDCGEAAVVNDEGCRHCTACGFSEC
jgi:ribonucleoside-diphosphate reductase alpha chain